MGRGWLDVFISKTFCRRQKAKALFSFKWIARFWWAETFNLNLDLEKAFLCPFDIKLNGHYSLKAVFVWCFCCRSDTHSTSTTGKLQNIKQLIISYFVFPTSSKSSTGDPMISRFVCDQEKCEVWVFDNSGHNRQLLSCHAILINEIHFLATKVFV